MLNYLSLLGWNDGSEQEIYSVEELQKAFSLERITKSAAGAGQGVPGGVMCPVSVHWDLAVQLASVHLPKHFKLVHSGRSRPSTNLFPPPPTHLHRRSV